MISRLPADELAHFERKLRDRQAELLEALRGAGQRAAAETFTQVASEAPDPEDAAFADVVEDLNAAERERDTDELHEVEAALERVASGLYGLCERCGQRIEHERLETFPTAKYDVRCQEIIDRERGAPRPPTL